jgi:hypothetical protein
MAVHAMHLLWDKLSLSARAIDTVFVFVTLAPMPLLAIAIYLCFEKPVTRALQMHLRNKFVPLRPFTSGPTSPVGASRYALLTRVRVASEHAAKAFALIAGKPHRENPATLLINSDRRQANLGDGQSPAELDTALPKEIRQGSNLPRFPSVDGGGISRSTLTENVREHHRYDDGALT